MLQLSATSKFLLATVLLGLATIVLVAAACPSPIKKCEFSKKDVTAQPCVRAGDPNNGCLVEVLLNAKSEITDVHYDCFGTECSHVHPCGNEKCAAANSQNLPNDWQCSPNGNSPLECNGNEAIWRGWTDSTEDCVLVFTVTSR